MRKFLTSIVMRIDLGLFDFLVESMLFSVVKSLVAVIVDWRPPSSFFFTSLIVYKSLYDGLALSSTLYYLRVTSGLIRFLKLS